ncbi:MULTISPECIES: LemA family protein [unclassified Thiocapsa]|uniref:LemA family protein n=1 Tax=unclassified Thiocapsa TaxID=2641286 RepID=UPI0035B178BF
MSSKDQVSSISAARAPPSGHGAEGRADQLAGPAKRTPHPRLRLAAVAALLAAVTFLGLLLVVDGRGGDPLGAIQDVRQTINTIEGVGAMNRAASSSISVVLFALPVILGLLYFVWLYNGIVGREEAVYNAWADVESTYKRRADLVPNLVNAVRSYMEHERTTLTEVTDRRDAVGEALDALVAQQTAAADALRAATPDSEQGVAMLGASQSALLNGLRGVMATVEAYPDLRSADQFLALQAELEGTENRINVARLRFNEAVQDFNGAIRRLPGSLVAGIGQFQRKAYFTADAGDEQAVQVRIEH